MALRLHGRVNGSTLLSMNRRVEEVVTGTKVSTRKVYRVCMENDVVIWIHVRVAGRYRSRWQAVPPNGRTWADVVRKSKESKL